MSEIITSDANDTLETILKKIQSRKDLKGKLNVYTLFRMTKAGSINNINLYIQLMKIMERN